MLFNKRKTNPDFITISQGITSCIRLFAGDMKVDRVLKDTKEDVESSGIREIFEFGIQNPGLWNP